MLPSSPVHSRDKTIQFGVYTQLNTTVTADRNDLHITTTLDGHHLYTERIPRQHVNLARILQRAEIHFNAIDQLIQRLQSRLDKPDLKEYDAIILTQRVTNHLCAADIPPITAAVIMTLLNRPFGMNDQRLPTSGPHTDRTFSLHMPAEGPATLTLTGTLFPDTHLTEQLIWECLIPDIQRLKQISINGISSLRLIFPGQHDTIRNHIERELHNRKVYTKRTFTHQLTSDRDPAALQATYTTLLTHTPPPPDLTQALALTQAVINLYR